MPAVLETFCFTDLVFVGTGPGFNLDSSLYILSCVDYSNTLEIAH